MKTYSTSNLKSSYIFIRTSRTFFKETCFENNRRICRARPLDPNSILTQLPLGANEFDAYLVGFPSELTFCQKELRALLNFCDLVSPVLRIYCDRPGKPVIFACTHETRLCARFVLATLPSDACTIPGSQRSQSVQRRTLVSKTPVQVRRVTLNSATQSQRLLRPALTDFDEDATFDEVTVLAHVLRESDGPDAVSAVDQSRTALSQIGNLNLTHTQPVNIVPSPIPPPRPFNVPRVCQAISITRAPMDSTDLNPAVKKARSALFSFIEQSEDADSMTAEDMDIELQQLTRPYSFVDPNISKPGTATPGRTVLVADSDEEN
ncbi:Cell cycle checkpoint control protein RAD9B [Fasciola gigantica]|uniref:Cell cycle checkpoint control protein RAD9B n=1 Tax=Fasciola gigantica TaxID=46835 RepID=A0A504YVD0_FASGI|nr:Cell cycle checkpoint control protein RAD9B [Fasciola gigantica]